MQITAQPSASDSHVGVRGTGPTRRSRSSRNCSTAERQPPRSSILTTIGGPRNDEPASANANSAQASATVDSSPAPSGQRCGAVLAKVACVVASSRSSTSNSTTNAENAISPSWLAIESPTPSARSSATHGIPRLNSFVQPPGYGCSTLLFSGPWYDAGTVSKIGYSHAPEIT